MYIHSIYIYIYIYIYEYVSIVYVREGEAKIEGETYRQTDGKKDRQTVPAVCNTNNKNTKMVKLHFERSPPVIR